MYNGGVPPNITYDENDPPIKNGCTGRIGLHNKDCKGNCDRVKATKLETELENEVREWARIGMDTRYVQHDLFRMNQQIRAIIKILQSMIHEELLNEEFQLCTLEEMRGIRLANQDQVKKQNLGTPGIIGPDGKRLM